MFLDDVFNRFLDLLFLLVEVFFCPAPLFGGVGGELAAVYCKHLFADQAHLITDQKHVAKQRADLFVHRGDKVGDRGEVRLCVGRERHEDDIVPAARFDPATCGDAAGVGVEDDLQQNRRIIRGGADFVVLVPGDKNRKVEFVVDEVIEGVFKGAGEDLLFEVNRNQLALILGVFFVSRHLFSSCR